MDNDPVTKPLEAAPRANRARRRDRDVVVTRGGGGRRFEWVIVGCVLALLFAVPVVLSVNARSSISATLTGAGSEGSADPGTAAPAGDPDSTDPAAQAAPAPTAAQPAPSTGHARAAVVAAEAAAAPSTELAVAVYDRVTRESAVGDRGTEPFIHGVAGQGRRRGRHAGPPAAGRAHHHRERHRACCGGR